MDLRLDLQVLRKQYNSLPFAYALDEPDPWRAVPAGERRQRGTLTTDRCVIDRKEFCVRGRLEIPVIDRNDRFIWGIWASRLQEGYERIERLWNAELREHEPPIPGTLCSDLPIYPRTAGLTCSLHLRERRAGVRRIELEPTDHPLAVEQRDGITLERVKEIASRGSAAFRGTSELGRLLRLRPPARTTRTAPDRARARRGRDAGRRATVSSRPRGVRCMKPFWIRNGSMISSMASRGSDSAAAMVSTPTGPPP